MSKKSKQASGFGSRKGTGATVVRGNVVKLQAERTTMFSEMEQMLRQAAAMPTAAAIVRTYQRDFGSLIQDKAELNDCLTSLCTVIKNHKEAVDEQRNKLVTMRESMTKIASSPNRNLETIKMLEWAGGVQDIMNDFASIGMFAIDKALDPFRELARANPDVPMPGYMTPRNDEDLAIVEQFTDPNTKPSSMVVLDVPQVLVEKGNE